MIGGRKSTTYTRDAFSEILLWTTNLIPSLKNIPALEGGLEAAQSHRSSTSGGSRIERRNKELEATLEDAQEAITERDQLIESLEDAKATLRLGVEQLDHERHDARMK
jgi:hypothetical protein